ncbi:MAG: cobalamin B12-binding domain-containing protein [Alphaproteobacteria bacterium]|nr:cobalamin B12-binding domain-containing protein [Alphaproteobacteria bacterium]
MIEPADLYRRLAEGAAPADLAAALVGLGDGHRARGEGPEAAAAYRAANALHESGPAWLGLGLVLLRDGPAALDALSRARDRFDAEGDPAGAATAAGNAGTAALVAGQPARAAALLRDALRRRADAGLPPDGLALCNLGRALSLQGDRDAALRAFREARAIGLTEDQPAAVGFASLFEGELLLQADPAGALEALTRAVDHLPVPAEAARARVMRAGLHVHAGDRAAAVQDYEAALPALAGRPLVEALVNLGGLRYLLRDPARAAAHLDRAAALLTPDESPLERRLRYNRGLALVAVNRLDEARGELERAAALADAPDRLPALAALVDLHRYQGALDEAIAAQGRVAALQQAHPDRVRESGMLYTSVEDRALNLDLASMRRAGPAPGEGPVLLVAPPAFGGTGPLFPRGAVSVASFLEANGVPARVLPLAAHVPADADVATAQARTETALADALDAYRPRAVGISVTFSYLYPQGQAIARAVRRLAPSVPILIGGPHVTYQDRECLLETPEIDVVVRGEGEWTALALVDALRRGEPLSAVPGITWRAPDGSVVRNGKRPLGNVLELPPVNFELLPADFCHRMDITALTSRGCAFRCRFCHEFRYWGGVVREHPVARALGEMERLAAFGNHLQGIDDSMLDMGTDYFMELVAALGRSPHLTDNFGLLTRLDTIHDDGARAMRDAGLRWVMMGAESGSQTVLDAMNKGLRVAQIRQGLACAHRAGVSTSAFFIIGHPGDTPAETAQTLALVDEEMARGTLDWVDASTFTPYPGTPFYSSPDRHGIEILSRDWALWRRTNRPVAQLDAYPAGDIYLSYLKLLAVQDRHLKARRGVVAPPALGSGSAGA